MKTARKLGVTDAEIDRLSRAITDALVKGAKAPEELREAADGSVRNLGVEGAKRGLTTTLPVALGKLQSLGEIRRIPINGRLDQQRYRYALWQPNPLANFKVSPDEAYTELARRFFSWIGPATLGEFQWFSGLGAKKASAALAPLELVPFATGEERLILPEDRRALLSFRVPRKSQYALVSCLDGITHLRRDVQGLLAQEDLQHKILVDKSEQAAGQLSDLPSHGILDRGRLIGLWEYEVTTQSVVWKTFVPKDKQLQGAVKSCETYIREELGDARSFSLDSPKSRAARIEGLRRS